MPCRRSNEAKAPLALPDVLQLVARAYAQLGESRAEWGAPPFDAAEEVALKDALMEATGAACASGSDAPALGWLGPLRQRLADVRGAGMPQTLTLPP